jgi:hypothetical protein
MGLFLSRSFRKHSPSFFRRFFVRSESPFATVASRRAQELSRLVAFVGDHPQGVEDAISSPPPHSISIIE